MTLDRGPYGRTFVGREQELRQLERAFDAAAEGNGGLAMLVGEPGIGKTTVCRQLAGYVTDAGGLVLWGHCYEEASLSVPYAPFVEALNAYRLAHERLHDHDSVLSDASSTDLGRIISWLTDRYGEPDDPGAAQANAWVLIHTVAAFMSQASAETPMLVVLEDLHWADRGTLDLLQHLFRQIATSRLLVVGTYRDIEVDRTHPLAASLAELRRSGSFLRLAMRGLAVEDVQRMYASLQGAAVSKSQAAVVHRQTEGNPLFVEEVLRYLIEEGIVIRDSGPPLDARRRPVESLMPEGLRDVIGRRFSHLSPTANHVLSVAALLGREFSLPLLQHVLAHDEEATPITGAAVVEALEQAQERAVIEERPGRAGELQFRFTHAFLRETLYGELFAAKRIRLHRQAGRSIEALYPDRLENHAAALADHFAHSSDPDDLARAVAYARAAAQHAANVLTFGDAARHLEGALAAQESLDPRDTTRILDLLLELGDALIAAGASRRVLNEIAPRALRLARTHGAGSSAALVCQMAIEALYGA
ncbi:MAG TPA: AAA family ATPase, partial [Dehalococcoidia bacterium]